MAAPDGVANIPPKHQNTELDNPHDDRTTMNPSPTTTLTEKNDVETAPTGISEEKKTVMKEAPDGGAAAWLVVLGAWCTSFCSFGWINSKFYHFVFRLFLEEDSHLSSRGGKKGKRVY